MTYHYSTADTALLLVDVLNDFLDENGKLATAIGPMLEKTHLRSNLQRLLEGARGAGVKIFYVPHGFHEHSFQGVQHVLPRWQQAMANKIFWIGEWGAEFYQPLKPQAGEVVISRHRSFNAFEGTDLHAQLRDANIRNVVLAGLTSNTCIQVTGTQALESGFHVTYVADAVAEFTEELHKVALEVSYPAFGHEVTTVDKFLGAIVRV
jgi:nicotinamidase-related amidase